MMERRRKVSAVGLLQQAYLLLPRLASTVAGLPTIDQGNLYESDAHAKYWKPLYEDLKARLGEYAAYWEVFDPQHPEDDDPVRGSLADDLADIFCDLKKGLTAWSRAGAATRRDIVFTWRLNFEIHWGEHLTGAFRAIHSLLYDHIEGADEFPIGIRSE